MNYNRPCDIEDFADPELGALIRELRADAVPEASPIFPTGAEHRCEWEAAMAIRTLRDFDRLGPDATLLVVSAGADDAALYLSRHARQVFAVDRYLRDGTLDRCLPLSRLVDPQIAAARPFDPQRLVVQHMDSRDLRYPDNTFSGIVWHNIGEQVADSLDIAHSAYELGRVLQPEGVMSVVANLLVSGPKGGAGWPSRRLLLSPSVLRRHVIEASGLETVDDLRTQVSGATLATRREVQPGWEDAPEGAERTADGHPHLVRAADGYVYSSIHLALRKTAAYPAVPNQWARPGETVREAVRQDALRRLEEAEGTRPGAGAIDAGTDPPAEETPLIGGGLATGGGGEPREPVERSLPAASPWVPLHRLVGDVRVSRHALERELAALEVQRRITVDTVVWCDHAEAEIDGALEEVVRLEDAVAGHLRASGAVDGGIWPSSWRECTVRPERGVAFSLIVDADSDDPAVSSHLAGRLHEPDAEVVTLLLELTRPGEVVVDVGAGCGGVALAAAAAGRRVIAVEPSASSAALLRASATRNGFSSLVVVHAAAVELPDDAGVRDITPAQGMSPPRVPLDSLLAALGHPRPSFVRIEAGGAELGVVRGMASTLGAAGAPLLHYRVSCPALQRCGSDVEMLLAQLEELGYLSFLADSPRLIGLRSSEFYPRITGSHLALKERPVRLRRWRIEPGLTHQERVSQIMAECSSPHADRRAAMGARLAGGDTELLEDSRVLGALRRLAEDPSEAVRSAVAWFARPSGSPRAGGPLTALPPARGVA